MVSLHPKTIPKHNVHKSPIYHPDKCPSFSETTYLTLFYKLLKWRVFFILREKITSSTCLLGSGLKVIFY